MRSGKLFVGLICVVVSVVLITQLYGCGTIIYPERRGQTGGTVDGGIAIMDALWLLVFIVPGVVAFAIDFSTGAIYFPHGSKRSSGPGEYSKMTVVRVDPRDLNEAKIKAVVMKETGLKELDLNRATIYELNEPKQVEAELARIAQSGNQIR
jgi:hypothetical protein